MKTERIGAITSAIHLLRLQICEWFGAEGVERVIIAPGILISLRLFLSFLNVHKLLMTTSEYYAPAHFPGIETRCCDPDVVATVAQKENPDAVLMSVATWRGQPLKVQETFRQIASTRAGLRPLMIADYAHAGAVGFPEISGLNADITVGDLGKWVLPPGLADNIAFLHVTNSRFQGQVLDVFRPFYLGTEESSENSARWLTPSEIIAAARWMRRNPMRRRDLLRQYDRNRRLAKTLACSQGVSDPTCIIWATSETDTVRHLAKDGLVWRRDDGIRVICRDLAHGKKERTGRSKLGRTRKLDESR